MLICLINAAHQIIYGGFFMIFYFTGTGNSRYAAKKIADGTNDIIYDMSELLKSGKMSYTVKTGEKVGFVFPIYYSGLPSVVSDFLENINIIADNDCYIYAVITCGANAVGADTMFRKAISKYTFETSYVYELKMPDNYVMMYNPCDKETAEKFMNHADRDISDIIDNLNNNKKGGFNSGIKGKIMSSVMQKLYSVMRTTKQFYVTNECISCGKCEKDCPIDVIKMTDGKPVWTQSKCAHCTACINKCPAKAIQFGKGTVNRGRYLLDKQ